MKHEAQDPFSIRLVRGDENAVSIGGKQIQIWPPGRAALGGFIGFLFLLFLAYLMTFGRVSDYENRFAEQDRRLESYRIKVMELETSLMKAQEMVAKVANMAGVDFDYTPVNYARQFDSTDDASIGVSTPLSDMFMHDMHLPMGLPLEGYVSQGYIDTASGDKFHPGIDLAVKVGSPVLATGSGTVKYAGEDEIYGLIVVVQHNDTIETVYGHNSELLVETGDPVLAGSRIALSGNTGKSTAPHLHYEIRIHGEPINPAIFLGGVD